MAQLKTKILLFGRTGSGKSTLANVIINGNLDPPLLFGTSSGIRGKTLDMQREETESKIVVDTVGLGEAEGGSVSDEEARNRLFDFFVKLSEGYHYFAYVHKWGKIDYLDTNLWNFFKQAFQGAEDNFLLIFTHSKPEYIEQHRADLKSIFAGCQRYVSVDFPTDRPHEISKLKLKINGHLRVESLKRLESSLENFMEPSIVPWAVSNMSKGQLYLIGGCASSRNMIAKLLVDGVLEPSNLSSTGLEEPHQVDPSSLDGGDHGYSKDQKAPIVLTTYTEVQGRGWEVVNIDNFDLKWEVGAEFAFRAHRSIEHIVFVLEDTCELSTEDRTIMKKLQSVWKINFVALVIDTRVAGLQKMGETKIALKVGQALKHCTFVLHLCFPTFSTLEEVESQNIQIRKESLKILENTLYANLPLSDDQLRSFAMRLAPMWRGIWPRDRLRPRFDDEVVTFQIVHTNLPFAYLKVKSRLAAPSILHVHIGGYLKDCMFELQLVDIHGKDKEVPRLHLDCDGEDCDGEDWGVMDTCVCRKRVSETTFLDSIQQGETIVLWVIPDCTVKIKSGWMRFSQ